MKYTDYNYFIFRGVPIKKDMTTLRKLPAPLVYKIVLLTRRGRFS